MIDVGLACYLLLAHLTTDRISSRMSKRYYEQGRIYAFWKVIGLDQLTHTATLLWTCSWFVS